MLSCNLISLDTGNVALYMFLQEDHEIIDAGEGEGRRCMIFLLFNIFLYPSSPAGFLAYMTVQDSGQGTRASEIQASSGLCVSQYSLGNFQ